MRISSALLVHIKGWGSSFQVFIQCLYAAMLTELRKLPGHLGEQPLDLVNSGRIRRCEVHVEPGMLSQPGLNRRAFVDGVVVAGGMDIQVLGHSYGRVARDVRDQLFVGWLSRKSQPAQRLVSY